jgi:hypothetical protein
MADHVAVMGDVEIEGLRHGLGGGGRTGGKRAATKRAAARIAPQRMRRPGAIVPGACSIDFFLGLPVIGWFSTMMHCGADS